MDIRSTMKVNLAQVEMGTMISSSQLSSDGYPVTNLLTNSSQGFLVEYFIRPPVLIHVEFTCNIFVHEVIIHTRVGTQKSKGVEILVNESTVGKCYLDPQQDVVQWVRHAGTEKIKDCTWNNSFSKCSFYSGAHKHLNSTKKLTIRVFKTENSSLVALKSLKIFGSVNRRTNTEADMKRYVELLNGLHNRSVSNETFCSKLAHASNNSERSISFSKENTEEIPNSEHPVESLTDKDSVPEDFLDPITHEFMTNPLILPCGKIIDKTTLDKYLQAELTWNRLPNDPFTHVKFAPHQKPVQAVQLKSRIDKFLLLNSGHSSWSKLPRTFQNRKTSHENLLFRMLDSQFSTSRFVEKSKRGIVDRTEESGSSPAVKRRKVCLKIDNTDLSRSNICQTVTAKNPSEPNTDIKVQIVDLTEHLNETRHCEVNEAEDLEQRIQNTLKNLPSFIEDSSKLSPRNGSSKSCFRCNQDSLLYKITTCPHHVCRTCLVSHKNDVCKICHVPFSSSNVIRIFNS